MSNIYFAVSESMAGTSGSAFNPPFGRAFDLRSS